MSNSTDGAASTGPLRLRARTQMIADDSRLILRLGSRVRAIAPFDEIVEHLIHALAKGITRGEALKQAAAFGPEAAEFTSRLMDQLVHDDFIEQFVEAPPEIPSAQLARLSRLLDFFSEFEQPGITRYDYMCRVMSARVAVLGTGGLGSWVTYNLACMGVGELVLIDGDKVEASNLNRSILYTEADIGRPKVEAARDSIMRFSPRMQVRVHEVFVDGAERLARLLEDVTLLISCADQPPSKIGEWVSMAARLAEVPCLTASGTRVGPLYIPGRTSCAMCDWASQVERNPRLPRIIEQSTRLPRGNSGSLSALATMASAPAALDAFRFLSGYAAPSTLNAVLRFEGTSGTTTTPLPPHPDCVNCRGAGVAAE